MLVIGGEPGPGLEKEAQRAILFQEPSQLPLPSLRRGPLKALVGFLPFGPSGFSPYLMRDLYRKRVPASIPTSKDEVKRANLSLFPCIGSPWLRENLALLRDSRFSRKGRRRETNLSTSLPYSRKDQLCRNRTQTS
jgi:hypothetical protein